MARLKKAAEEPIVTRGSHSTRTVYPDGCIEFVTHWDELERDVLTALEGYKHRKPGARVERVRQSKTKNAGIN
jgi:hypothetical protein